MGFINGIRRKGLELCLASFLLFATANCAPTFKYTVSNGVPTSKYVLNPKTKQISTKEGKVLYNATDFDREEIEEMGIKLNIITFTDDDENEYKFAFSDEMPWVKKLDEMAKVAYENIDFNKMPPSLEEDMSMRREVIDGRDIYTIEDRDEKGRLENYTYGWVGSNRFYAVNGQRRRVPPTLRDALVQNYERITEDPYLPEEKE